MSYKIGVLTASQDFIDLLINLAIKTPQIEIRSQIVNYYQAALAAHEMSKEVDVIIAREGTADSVEPNVSIPVIRCDYSIADILLSLSKTHINTDTITFFREKHRLKGFLEVADAVKKLTGKDIDVIPFSNYDDLDKKLASILTENRKTAVTGGKLINQTAAQYGLKSINIVTSPQTAQIALDKAVCSALLQYYEKEIIQHLMSIVENSQNSIIMINQNNKVDYINNQAKQLTKLALGEIVTDKTINTPFRDYLDIINKGNLIYNKKYNTSKISFSYNMFPLMNSKLSYKGCIISYDNVSITKPDPHGLHASYSFGDIIGKSHPINKVKELAKQFAKNDLSVLIIGDSGTGKEMLAHAIHNASPRSQNNFVAINCANIPTNLLESELFGYESGAFTGAKKDGKKGLFEIGDGGTIFLDEIGEMPLEIQARILRVLESKQVMRLGGNRFIKFDARFIAATNKNLDDEVKNGRFRNDLFYRLNTLAIHIPPLRERREDLAELFNFFLSEWGLEQEIKNQINKYIENLLNTLKSYSWPGNVRELKNLVNRCVIGYDLLEKGAINICDLITPFSNPACAKEYKELSATTNLKLLEKQTILKVGKELNWNKSQMANALGISQTTLWRKMKEIDNIDKLRSDFNPV